MASNIDKQLSLFEDNLNKFKLVMKISGGFTVFSTLISIYLIVFRSPEVIKNYKPFLLSIVVSIIKIHLKSAYF
jgi:hypothetical protein